jgi:hypothetical protein
MTDEMLRGVLDAAQAKTDKDGWEALPEGRTITLYTAHDGVSLNVGKVESVRIGSGVLRARTTKGEVFFLALGEVFAAAIDGAGTASSGRKAGFLG